MEVGKIRLTDDELKGTPTADFEFTLVGYEKAPTKEAIIKFNSIINQIANEWGFKLVDPVKDEPKIIIPH